MQYNALTNEAKEMVDQSGRFLRLGGEGQQAQLRSDSIAAIRPSPDGKTAQIFLVGGQEPVHTVPIGQLRALQQAWDYGLEQSVRR